MAIEGLLGRRPFKRGVKNILLTEARKEKEVKRSVLFMMSFGVVSWSRTTTYY